MEPYLKDNKVCPNTNKRCKVCKFDTCQEVCNMIETQKQAEERWEINNIKKSLPEQCQNCSFLEITNLREGKVFCPYRIKERCLIK